VLVKDGFGRQMTGQFGLRFRLPRKSQGSFTCRKSATWNRLLYFLSEGINAVDFFGPKNPTALEMLVVYTVGVRILSFKQRPTFLLLVHTL
jgi:hypothetical protein